MHIAVKIEGIGLVGEQYRLGYATRESGVDPDGVWLPAVDFRSGLPKEVGTSFDPHKNTAASGEITFDFIDVPELRSSLLRAEHKRSGIATFPMSQIGETLTVAAALVNADGSLVNADDVVMWGREAMLVRDVPTSTTYTVTRGVWGTRATAHAADLGRDVEIFDASTFPIANRRLVELVVCDNSGTYADEQRVWLGVLERATEPVPGRISVRCRTLRSLLEEVLIAENLWRAEKYEVLDQFNPDNPRIVEFRSESPAPPTGPSGGVLLSVGGKTAVVTDVFNLSGGGSTTSIRKERSDEASFTPTVPPAPILETINLGDVEEVHQMYATGAYAPADSATPAINTLPLSRNPITLTLQLLTSSADGDNGTYDTGYDDLGAGSNIPVSAIDVAGMELLRSELGASIDVPGFLVGETGKPEKLYPLIQQRILRPFGLTLVDRPDVGFTIIAYRDAAILGARVLDETEVIGVGPQTRQVTASDYVTARYDGRPGRKPKVDKFRDAHVTARQGKDQNALLDLRGITAPDAGLAYTRAALEAQAHLQTWRTDQRRVQLRCLRSATDIQLGNMLSLTHGEVTALDGTRGVTNTPVLVIGRADRLETGKDTEEIELVVLLVHAFTRIGSIAPSAVITAWSPGTLTATLSVGHNVGNAPYESPVSFWKSNPGAALYLTERNHDYRALAVVASADPALHTVTLSALPAVSPAAGMILKTAGYDQCITAQQETWAYLAYAGNTPPDLGAAGDDAKQWVTRGN